MNYLLNYNVNRVAPEKAEMSTALSHPIWTSNIRKDNLMKHCKDITNQRFSSLVAIKKVGSAKDKQSIWLCKCDCGKYSEVQIGNLTSGNTKTCGDTIHRIKHFYNRPGKRHPLYNVLHHIKDRCYNQNDKAYYNYGGRGITVCDEWKNDYKKFIEWCLSNGWEKGLYIDRIDNDGNYDPNNCRFVDVGLNNRNQRILQKNNTTGYRGVYKYSDNRWFANITHDSRAHHLGIFNSPRLAALRYDVEAFLLNDGRPMNFISAGV